MENEKKNKKLIYFILFERIETIPIMWLLSEYTGKSQEYFNYEKVSDILYDAEKRILVSKYFPDYGKHSEHPYLGPEPSFEEMHWKAVQKQKEEKEWEEKEKKWEEFIKGEKTDDKKEKIKPRQIYYKKKENPKTKTSKKDSLPYKNIDLD